MKTRIKKDGTVEAMTIRVLSDIETPEGQRLGKDEIYIQEDGGLWWVRCWDGVAEWWPIDREPCHSLNEALESAALAGAA
jgi:hypothetical protein